MPSAPKIADITMTIPISQKKMIAGCGTMLPTRSTVARNPPSAADVSGTCGFAADGFLPEAGFLDVCTFLPR